MKSLALLLALFAAPAFAGEANPETGNPVLDAMTRQYGEYDAACRGTNPSDGSEGYCGARAYIGWVLAQNNVCLDTQATGRDIWIACDAPSAYKTPDPISDDLRSMF